MKKIPTVLTALALSVCISGCGKKNLLGSNVTSSFSMTAASKPSTVVMQKSWLDLIMPRALALVPSTIVDSTGATIVLNSSWVVVKEIEFEATQNPAAGEVDGAEVKFKGPYFVDLLSIAPVVLDTQPIPASGFQRVKMKLESSGGATLLPPGAPAALATNSIYVTGSVGANAFTFQSIDGTEIHIGGASTVTPVDNGHVLVEINFSNIFKQINMSGVVNNEVISTSARHAGANLCASIDPSANDIYTCIRKGIELRANVGEDVDHNDSLDASEAKVK
jgi:hypothetical protein